jgi:hypothetical protein
VFLYSFKEKATNLSVTGNENEKEVHANFELAAGSKCLTTEHAVCRYTVSYISVIDVIGISLTEEFYLLQQF